MRVFVTGATGVVGRRAVPRLVELGHQVTAVGRSAEKRAGLEAAGATAVDVDLFNERGLTAALAGHDAVVNLATHIPGSPARMMIGVAWRENDRVRREGSAAVATAALAAGVPRLIQESFAPIYADNGDRWIDEGHTSAPTRYNRTVLDAEHSAARFTEAGGTGVVLRFAAFYGPDAFHVRGMLDMMRWGWFPLPGPPDAYVSSVSHDDAASAVVAALEIPAGTYNVSDDVPLTRREWAAALADAAGIPRPKPLPAWMSHLGSFTELMSRSLRISNGRLRSRSSWVPCYPSVREGFRDLARSASLA